MNNLTKLQQAVINQLGYDSLDDECKSELSDILNHGVSGGFGGFIYYSDTVQFFDDNKEIIMEALTDLAYNLGESKYNMIRNFNCLGADTYSEDNIVESIYTPDHEDETNVKNALAWFAAEHVAWQLEDQL